MGYELIPNKKEVNIFWSGIMASAITSLIGAFFVSSFFYLSTKYFDYGFWIYFLIFINTGVGLLLIILYAKKRIIPIKREDIIYK